MSWLLGIAIYVICWWLAFFVMLPMGAPRPLLKHSEMLSKQSL